MKRTKKILTMLIAASLFCAMFASVAEAASTKSVYVVTSIEYKGNDSPKTVTYNKKGFIKTIKYSSKYLKTTDSFTYDSKNQMTEYSNRIISTYPENHYDSTTTYKYKWKNGLVTQCNVKGYFVPERTDKYKYNSKKQLVSVSDGSKTAKYTYNKKGLVTKIISDNGITKTFSYDSNGNVTRMKTAYSSGYENTVKNTFTCYNSGRVKKMTATRGSQQTRISFTYKKITVNKSDAEAIANQQWKLINQMHMGVAFSE